MNEQEELKELVASMLRILHTKEVSDAGVEFYPTYIASSRILDMERMSEILYRLEEICGRN